MRNRRDVAVICLNGHSINSRSMGSPEFNTKFCKRCGAATINACPTCSTEIQGGMIDPVVVSFGRGYHAPAYCHECGQPYPWTVGKLEAAAQLIDLVAEIDEEDKEKLKASLPDIANHTPNSDVAVKRWQTVAKKTGGVIYDAVIKIGTDVASEYAKKVFSGQI